MRLKSGWLSYDLERRGAYPCSCTEITSNRGGEIDTKLDDRERRASFCFTFKKKYVTRLIILKIRKKNNALEGVKFNFN